MVKKDLSVIISSSYKHVEQFTARCCADGIENTASIKRCRITSLVRKSITSTQQGCDGLSDRFCEFVLFLPKRLPHFRQYSAYRFSRSPLDLYKKDVYMKKKLVNRDLLRMVSRSLQCTVPPKQCKRRSFGVDFENTESFPIKRRMFTHTHSLISTRTNPLSRHKKSEFFFRECDCLRDYPLTLQKFLISVI